MQICSQTVISVPIDPANGAVFTILDQILVSANRLRESSKRITYNWEVSTLATEQLAALEGQDADVGCLMQTFSVQFLVGSQVQYPRAWRSLRSSPSPEGQRAH